MTPRTAKGMQRCLAKWTSANMMELSTRAVQGAMLLISEGSRKPRKIACRALVVCRQSVRGGHRQIVLEPVAALVAIALAQVQAMPC